jgi:hypothetical protein
VEYLDALYDEITRADAERASDHELGFSQGAATATRWCLERPRTRSSVCALGRNDAAGNRSRAQHGRLRAYAGDARRRDSRINTSPKEVLAASERGSRRRASTASDYSSTADTRSAGRFSPGCLSPHQRRFPIDEARESRGESFFVGGPFPRKRIIGRRRASCAARRCVQRGRSPSPRTEGLGHRGRSASLGEARTMRICS